jgi:hypothetical protein
MATLGASALTLVDWAKRLDPDGQVPVIVEMLSQMNEIYADALWMEGNLPTGHRTTMRTGLPTAAWKQLNQGVQPSKSTTVQVDDRCGILEAWSEVDVDLAELNGNTNAFRLSESQPFIETMSQNIAGTLLYGDDTVTKEKFLGLTPRYNSLSAGTAQNIIDCGGTGSDNTSIWLIVWGANTVHGIFPKGSKAGIVHDDLGVETVETTAGLAGNRMRAYRDRYQAKVGLSVRDWRYAVRAANIDVSNLVSESSAADIVKVMIKMLARVPSLGLGTPVFYANRTVREMLDIQALNKASYTLTVDNVDGKPVTSFRGIPVRTVDQILGTEARVV